MFDRLEAILERFNKVNEMLSQADILNDIQKLTALSKESADLRESVDLYLKYKKNEEELIELEEMKLDPELKEYCEEETLRIKNEQPILIEAIQIQLIPKDPNDEKNVIVEIRGAAGGDEANIFAGDLYRMYSKYAETKKWKIEVINSMDAPNGGFTLIEFVVSGKSVYSHLKFESGSHRVQRIPETDSGGRIHTSTATVLVMPEVEEIEVEINTSDLKIDVYRSSGAGGQSVNTTDSAVRITHLPTNTVVSCQDGRSQHENKAAAMKILRARVYDSIMQKHNAEIGAERRDKVGGGDRSEKIRTYNYPQNRVTDHRINFTLQQLDRIMEGKLEAIIEALINEDQKRKLESYDN